MDFDSERSGPEGPAASFARERQNVGAGWQPIIEALHRDLTALDPGYQVLQIKEKFGGLRYYTASSEGLPDDTYNEMQRLIAVAEELSDITCEKCGAPGEVRNENYWLRTLCDACEAKRTAVKP